MTLVQATGDDACAESDLRVPRLRCGASMTLVMPILLVGRIDLFQKLTARNIRVYCGLRYPTPWQQHP